MASYRQGLYSQQPLSTARFAIGTIRLQSLRKLTTCGKQWDGHDANMAKKAGIPCM